MIAGTDRVFVPAAFAGRLAHMPGRSSAPGVRAAWLCAQLADLTGPAVLASGDGLAALRLATQVQRELSILPIQTRLVGSRSGAAGIGLG